MANCSFRITLASIADITALKAMEMDIEPGSTLYGDKAYTDYAFKDVLSDEAKAGDL